MDMRRAKETGSDPETPQKWEGAGQPLVSHGDTVGIDGGVWEEQGPMLRYLQVPTLLTVAEVISEEHAFQADHGLASLYRDCQDT